MTFVSYVGDGKFLSIQCIYLNTLVELINSKGHSDFTLYSPISIVI